MKLASHALTAALLIGSTITASAADMTSLPGYDWSGFYAGMNVGAAWNGSELQQDYTEPPVEGQIFEGLDHDFTDQEAAFSGGLMLGYNWQSGRIVIGAEGDVNYLGFEATDQWTRVVDSSPDYDPVRGTSELSFTSQWFATVRGRLGFTAGSFLFYGTGGLAIGEVTAEETAEFQIGSAVPFSYDGSTSSTNVGWTAGGGIEYGLDRWSLGAEYLYVDLGDAEWSGNFNTDVPDTLTKGHVDVAFSVARLTAKLRF